MKKLMMMVMVLVLVFGSVAYAAPSEWALETVETVAEKNLLDERAFSDYQDNITRKDFAYLGVRLYEELTGEMTSVGDASFDDTNDEFVLKAKNAGFINGVGNGLFEPDRDITRDEIAALFVKLYNATGVEYEPASSAKEFADADKISDWAKEFVKIARANGIVNGVGDNMFEPKAKASREVAIIMFNRTLEKFKTEEVTDSTEEIIDEEIVDEEIEEPVDNTTDNNQETTWEEEVAKLKVVAENNPNDFPEWAISEYETYNLFDYATETKGIYTDAYIFKKDEENGPISEDDYSNMVKSFSVMLPTIETYDDYVENINVSKTMPKTTEEDWDRAYLTLTQENGYPELTRERFDLMKDDVLDIFEGARVPLTDAEGNPTEETWLGFIDDQYFYSIYDLGNGLAGIVMPQIDQVKMTVLPRESDVTNEWGETFLDNVNLAKEYPNIVKYVDLRNGDE